MMKIGRHDLAFLGCARTTTKNLIKHNFSTGLGCARTTTKNLINISSVLVNEIRIVYPPPSKASKEVANSLIQSKNRHPSVYQVYANRGSNLRFTDETNYEGF